jgi:hypothetical protein
MATIMKMHWPEVTKEQYEKVREVVNWEGDVPQGAKFHLSWFGNDGFHVLDLWETRDDFEAFAQNRLPIGIQAAGVAGEPTVAFEESHAIFAPNP